MQKSLQRPSLMSLRQTQIVSPPPLLQRLLQSLSKTLWNILDKTLLLLWFNTTPSVDLMGRLLLQLETAGKESEPAWPQRTNILTLQTGSVGDVVEK